MTHLLTSTRRQQSLNEEIANSISHGLGFLAAAVAAPYLILNSFRAGGTAAVIGSAIFVVSALVLYLSSVIYHALPPTRTKQVFQLVDHSAIYLLIAGTYTPFTLGVLHGAWGWSLLTVVWTMAIAGIILKIFFGMRFPRLSLALYLIMGWTVVVAAKPLSALMPTEGLVWLAAGGISYTLGVFFYAIERVKYFHFIWHLFVLAGTACHFVAVLKFAF